MRKLKRQLSLFELEPLLVKEWHPTLNDGRTPQNVKIIYPKKVWWICNEGHEWRATIKSRIKGYGCPLCKKNPAKIESDDFINRSIPKRNDKIAKNTLYFETDDFNSDFYREHRKSNRFRCNVTAIIEIPSSEHWVYANILNFSHRGLYFETEVALKKGTIIKLKMDRPFLYFSNESYSSIIKWCKKLDEGNESIANFGHGGAFI